MADKGQEIDILTGVLARLAGRACLGSLIGVTVDVEQTLGTGTVTRLLLQRHEVLHCARARGRSRRRRGERKQRDVRELHCELDWSLDRRPED